MAYWFGWIVKPFVNDPGKRSVRRKRPVEPPNPELVFTDSPDTPVALPTAAVPVAPLAEPNDDLNFGPAPGALALARNDRYQSAGRLLSCFWLAIGLFFIAPFLIVVVGFIFAYLGSFFVADVPHTLRVFLDADQEMLARYRAGWRDVDGTPATNIPFADRIEQDLLPRWQAAGARFTSQWFVSESDRPLLALARQYIVARQEGLELTAQGLRSGDFQELRAARLKMSAADRLGEQLAERLP